MISKFIFFCVVIFTSFISFGKELDRPHNFQQAKNIANHIFLSYQETIYSGCKLDAKKHINITSCGFEPKPNGAIKLEYEHMMPMASANHFACWRESLCKDSKGRSFKCRRCCQQIDPSFRRIEAELYNIWPELAEINRKRSNFKFTEFSAAEKKRLGKYRGLPIYIDFWQRKIEPRDEVKGLVARASLFVFRQYKVCLSQAQLKLFQYWNKKYPPKEMELKWAAKIARIEGHPNTFISEWDEHLV